MTWPQPLDLTRRERAARTIVLAAFAVLALAFVRVQVLLSDRYKLDSDKNRLRQVLIPAPRGQITDRNGVVLAENVPGYSVSLLASAPESLTVELERINAVLPTSAADRARILERYSRMPSDPVLIARDVPFAQISALEELRVWHPGLVIQSDPRRHYPYGEVTAHLVGYVGEATEDELRSREYRGLRLGSEVGRDGLEQEYDAELRGRDGARFIEQDALGRTVREGQPETVLPPEPGTTIRTAVDIELQQYVHDQFPPRRRGAVMAMDPRTGGVLALYSSPTYDPNAFIGGMDPDEWRALMSSEDYPLFNRATQARYAPASPWKLAVAAIALRDGVVTMDSHMPTPCRGGLLYGNRYFRCWKVEGHGDLNLEQAIQYSCDVYFYQLGIKLGLEGLLSEAVGLGFQEPSGIDLPHEARPSFPTSTAYYDQRYGRRGWTSGVTLNLAIGQGENAQTLANMVRFYAMLASPHGEAPEPRVVPNGPGRMRSLGLSDDELAGLRKALVLAVARGTAQGAVVQNLTIAGKTGTGQNPHGLDNGWFIGFAPADSPEIVVGAIEEHAEHGSRVAPMVTRIIARYLLGPDAVSTFARERLEVPDDSAPGSIPILPDSALLRSRDSSGAPTRNR